jgi:hypothetical protein
VRRVAVTVELDVVAALDERPRELGLGLDLLADEEEGGPRAGRVERLQHAGRVVSVRAVVEAQNDPLGPLRPLPAREAPPALQRVDLLAEVGHGGPLYAGRADVGCRAPWS